MMKHNAAAWFSIAQLLQLLRHSIGNYDDDERQEDIKIASMLAKECEQIGLTMASISIERFRRTLQSPITKEVRSDAIDEIQTRITDEMGSTLFLYVPRERSRYYTDNALFGDLVSRAFPETAYDIEEAGKCLALGRGTGCVFHLMRVMEILLRYVASLLKISYVPSWEAYISQISNRVAAKYKTKNARWKKNEAFFTDVLGELTAVKIAWRNPTMHVRAVHTVEEAENIFRAVQSFAKRLAERKLAVT
jgi:hypothetical protein